MLNDSDIHNCSMLVAIKFAIITYLYNIIDSDAAGKGVVVYVLDS